MDNNKENEIILLHADLINYPLEVMKMAKEEDLLNNVYREISEAMGTATAMQMYRLFRGQQITFPVRFFSAECIRQRIAEEYDGTNIGLLAKKYDYSEKTVRRFLKESKKESKAE